MRMLKDEISTVNIGIKNDSRRLQKAWRLCCRLNDDHKTIDVSPDDVEDCNLCCEILNLKWSQCTNTWTEVRTIIGHYHYQDQQTYGHRTHIWHSEIYRDRLEWPLCHTHFSMSPVSTSFVYIWHCCSSKMRGARIWYI